MLPQRISSLEVLQNRVEELEPIVQELVNALLGSDIAFNEELGVCEMFDELDRKRFHKIIERLTPQGDES